MGLVNKVFLHFDKPFWPKNQQVIFFAWPDAPWPECYNLEPVIGQPILMAIKSGERARRDESKPDAEIVAALKMQLVQVFGAKVPEPLSSRITRWGNDPYSFGSYSFTKVGAISNDYEDLSLPVGEKLFFAGEATSRKHPATVAGAYLSGIREGRRIVSMGS
jgi:monoamine oxidase